MGAIASVLQWHCGNCSLINPTEQAKCSRCGAQRQFNEKADDNRSLSTIFGSNANCTVIRKPRHKEPIDKKQQQTIQDEIRLAAHQQSYTTDINCFLINNQLKW